MSRGDRLWAALFGVAGLGSGLFLLHEGGAELRDRLAFAELAHATATVVEALPVARTSTSSLYGMPQRRTVWVAVVRFRFPWEGADREGETVVPADGTEAGARTKAAALPPGATADVLLDPGDPSRVYFASERPSLATGLVLLGVGLFAVLLGGGLTVAAVRRGRPRRPA